MPLSPQKKERIYVYHFIDQTCSHSPIVRRAHMILEEAKRKLWRSCQSRQRYVALELFGHLFSALVAGRTFGRGVASRANGGIAFTCDRSVVEIGHYLGEIQLTGAEVPLLIPVALLKEGALLEVEGTHFKFGEEETGSRYHLEKQRKHTV